MEELHQVFSRYGVIAESLDSDQPRIKLYADDEGNFKGEALIGMSPHAIIEKLTCTCEAPHEIRTRSMPRRRYHS